MAARLLIPAALTVIIETAFFFLAGYREKWFYALCAAVNLMTNLTLNLILSALLFLRQDIMNMVLICLELLVVAAEYLCYSAALGKGKRLLLMTFAANLTSFLLGQLFYYRSF